MGTTRITLSSSTPSHTPPARRVTDRATHGLYSSLVGYHSLPLAFGQDAAPSPPAAATTTVRRRAFDPAQHVPRWAAASIQPAVLQWTAAAAAAAPTAAVRRLPATRSRLRWLRQPAHPSSLRLERLEHRWGRQRQRIEPVPVFPLEPILPQQPAQQDVPGLFQQRHGERPQLSLLHLRLRQRWAGRPGRCPPAQPRTVRR